MCKQLCVGGRTILWCDSSEPRSPPLPLEPMNPWVVNGALNSGRIFCGEIGDCGHMLCGNGPLKPNSSLPQLSLSAGKGHPFDTDVGPLNIHTTMYMSPSPPSLGLRLEETLRSNGGEKGGINEVNKNKSLLSFTFSFQLRASTCTWLAVHKAILPLPIFFWGG